jgi:hypothetical protein
MAELSNGVDITYKDIFNKFIRLNNSFNPKMQFIAGICAKKLSGRTFVSGLITQISCTFSF